MAKLSANSNETTNAKKSQSLSRNGNVKNTKASKTKEKKSNQTLDALFEEELKDTYNAEKQLIEALPEMAKAAYSEDLQYAFETHLQQTKRHAERLEKIFDRLDINKADDEICEAMEGLIKEGEQIIDEFEEGPVRDSALIIGAQKIEHYKIASYGSLCELADVLGYSKIAEILDYTLEEGEESDKELTAIARTINDEACAMSYEEEFV